MKIISSILNDFYICSKIPIKAIDKNLNLIYSIGYDDNLEKKYNYLDFKVDIPSLKNNKYITTKYNNINFTITNISNFNYDKGYYIIGPYTNILENDNLNKSIMYIPKHCINYLTSLLSTISEDRFSKGRVNLNVNLYIKKAIEYTMINYSSNLSADTVCKELNINKSYFCKLFKEDTGYTYSNYVNIFRIEKSKKLLLSSNMSLLDIAISVGFNSQNYFTMVFKKFTNMTPTQYRYENRI